METSWGQTPVGMVWGPGKLESLPIIRTFFPPPIGICTGHGTYGSPRKFGKGKAFHPAWPVFIGLNALSTCECRNWYFVTSCHLPSSSLPVKENHENSLESLV